MGTHLFNRYEDRLRAESEGYGLNPECRFLAELRSPDSAYECPLSGKKESISLIQTAVAVVRTGTLTKPKRPSLSAL